MDKISEFSVIWHKLIQFMQHQIDDEKYCHIKGLSKIEMSILQLVYNLPNIILKDICTELDIPKSTLTSAIKRLEKKGYVKRISINNDQRAYMLQTTELGKIAQQEHLDVEYSVISLLLNNLEIEETNMLLSLLQKATEEIDCE